MSRVSLRRSSRCPFVVDNSDEIPCLTFVVEDEVEVFPVQTSVGRKEIVVNGHATRVESRAIVQANGGVTYALGGSRNLAAGHPVRVEEILLIEVSPVVLIKWQLYGVGRRVWSPGVNGWIGE